jgi:rod shape-determining protein MreD
VKYRRYAIAVVLLISAVALQTTLFDRVRPFDTSPQLAVLALIAVVRHLEPEPALLFGFGTGLFLDLLEESPLGLWALVLTTAAFVVVRFAERTEDDPALLALGVFVLSAGALALFAVLGTIFGEKTLADAGVFRKVFVPAAYNVILAPLVLPAVTWLIVTRRRSGWGL